jgi:hypothetical protein
MNDIRTTSSPVRPSTRWRAVYTIAGGAAAAVAALNLMGPLQGFLGGCALTIEPLGWRVGGATSCRYVLDAVPVLVPAVAGSILLVGAWRYYRPDRMSTVVTGLAIPTAVAIALFPLYTVWWLIDYYRLSLGITEVVMGIAAGAVLGVALVAGWITARYLIARRVSDTN